MTAESHLAYMGEGVDHLYANCPNLRRRPVRQCVDRVDPEGTDLCKRCVNAWRKTQRALGDTDESTAP